MIETLDVVVTAPGASAAGLRYEAADGTRFARGKGRLSLGVSSVFVSEATKEAARIVPGSQRKQRETQTRSWLELPKEAASQSWRGLCGKSRRGTGRARRPLETPMRTC